MTREEMLKRLGLTQAENDELMHKLATFLSSLTPKQKKVVLELMPRSSDVVKSFGPDLKIEDLQTLATPDALAAGVAFFAFPPPAPGPPLRPVRPVKPVKPPVKRR